MIGHPELSAVPAGPAIAQQPAWHDHPDHPAVCAWLSKAPPLVTWSEIGETWRAVALVAAGAALLIQAGDCAESLDECTEAHVGAKVAMLDRLAGQVRAATGTEVIAAGRMGGQFAKPRSHPVERHGDRELPAFRGHMVNAETMDPEARRPDPWRMVRAYRASDEVLRGLRRHRRRRRPVTGASVPCGPWSSHEALVLDYEANLIRTDAATGAAFLGSTHLPWVGERTRQGASAHLALLAAVGNPVACKIGPSATVADVLAICEQLDPDRRAGRLTLIARMGAEHVGAALPPLITAVRRRGHPVVWLCDPMHGNTVRTSDGLKTRHLRRITAEALTFRDTLLRHRLHPGGLHLEVAASDVTECIGGRVRDENALRTRYTTLCDPRLNPDQASALLAAWTS
ncbi:3-deoxy-7-phosphoheptulonate synthase [Nonomuraea typhae]|uniref:Phospho-2-dehydro-3-deoxyheptonate aldolase n=1 Tax=Nonomuraea typhae TaxID=2603600 RepID=A0ABW7YQ46_9ACTN